MLILSLLLLHFHENQAAGARALRSLPMDSPGTMETDYVIFIKEPPGYRQQFEIPIYRAYSECTEFEGVKNQNHYSALKKELALETQFPPLI